VEIKWHHYRKSGSVLNNVLPISIVSIFTDIHEVHSRCLDSVPFQ
jgi:hypothetical protein